MTAFNAELFQAVKANTLLSPVEFVDRQNPLATIAEPLQVWTPAINELLQAHAPADILYYILLSSREPLPHFFPVHDINVLAAELLKRKIVASKHLVLLDWEMLPAAVLAVSSTASDIRVTLPSCPGQERVATAIMQAFNTHLRCEAWSVVLLQHLPEGCVVLGQNPLQHSNNNSLFLDELATTQGGIMYSTWDTLGVRIHAHSRSHWVKTGLIRSILQLPRPRRQGTSVYPALIVLDERPVTSIRVAQIAACRPGPGGLDIQHGLDLLDGKADGVENADVSLEAIAQDGLFNLSPAYYLTQKAMPVHTGKTLRHYAQVLRCQLARERIEEDIIVPDGEEWAGEYSDGTFVGREVSLGELDPASGFLNETGGNIVRLELTRLGKQGKYLLQSGDIIFAFRGTANSVGQVGYVEEEGIPGITGQSLCIIRPLPGIDSVWLYYYLQRKSVREWIQGRASGSTLLTVNLESIRDIPVEAPAGAEVDAVNEQHRKIAGAMAGIMALRQEVRVARWQIHEAGIIAGQIAAIERGENER